MPASISSVSFHGWLRLVGDNRRLAFSRSTGRPFTPAPYRQCLHDLSALAAAARPPSPFSLPCTVTARVVLANPLQDLSSVWKVLLDSLQHGRVLLDDRLVIEEHLSRFRDASLPTMSPFLSLLPVLSPLSRPNNGSVAGLSYIECEVFCHG